MHGVPFSFTPMNHASTRARWWLFDLQIAIGRNGEAEGQGISRLYRIQCSSSSVAIDLSFSAEYNAVRRPWRLICHFRRKYLKDC